ncbi:MAG: response regulator [Acidobacteria bacterium]|nr:response regulator [Acidobacteriota bacterium]
MAGGAPSRPLVLVADDEPSIRETVSFILEMEGFAVAGAEDGEQALAEIRRLRPPVVLLDGMMPLRDGFDVCREVKADPELAAVKIVMLTALGQKTDREKAVAAGADVYITKPFDEDELLALLRRLTAGS